MPRMFTPVRFVGELVNVTHGTHGIVVAIEPLAVFDRSFFRVRFPTPEQVEVDLSESAGQLCAMLWLVDQTNLTRRGQPLIRGRSAGASWRQVGASWELRVGSVAVVFDDSFVPGLSSSPDPSAALAATCVRVAEVGVPANAVRARSILDLRAIAVQDAHYARNSYCACACCRGVAGEADVAAAEEQLDLDRSNLDYP